MKVQQAVVLANASDGADGLLSSLKRLGVDITTMSDPAEHILDDWSGRLLICDDAILSTDLGRSLVRRAAADGIAIVDDAAASVLAEHLGSSREVPDDLMRSTAARALFACVNADALELSALQKGEDAPRYLICAHEKVQDLRYGENWHQKAALYSRPGGLGLFSASKLNGKEMSYNNVVDAEATLEMLIDLSQYDGRRAERPLAVIVKHANPCGVAYGASLEEAYRGAFATDPKSAFGGVIGFDRPVDLATAKAIGDSFVEVLLAPGFEPEALEMLGRNKPNRRILDIGDMLSQQDRLYRGWTFKGVMGGLLLQDFDRGDLKEWKVVTKRAPSPEETRALRFAWKVTKYVKSNALVYTTADRTIGIGSGQVSRVDAARFGAEKAEEHGLDTRGTVAATDSFFPFRDGLDQTYLAGATAVIHPGGSIRDEEVIRAADEHDMAMVFTGMRHFRH
ncbi:MAG TPA: phosphoribosylaminoimidazolecarboxamide formyltransferase [Methanotrichaceae archaeon]|nr:phosphoribosylaminoimidazolecarboxamide formyltransferase [Methanotrichaceae archaeon]HQF16202.1 phosphoribosylaminoimidazolecarboxamide formyltransferase [Methanotrichaceae archaeon]HQI90938.1 phosphoribosylaminoimidazolecarboxamide formyltransferase [Methanotrichaceae archaeon]HQJ28360.1 phosphoribosylaminoimidazolecarboxamide formyltransferase [Methanotrichaceae archaeon]